MGGLYPVLAPQGGTMVGITPVLAPQGGTMVGITHPEVCTLVGITHPEVYTPVGNMVYTPVGNLVYTPVGISRVYLTRGYLGYTSPVGYSWVITTRFCSNPRGNTGGSGPRERDKTGQN